MSAFSSLSEHTPLVRGSSSLDEAPGASNHSTRAEVALLLRFCVPTYITLMLEMSLFAVTVVVVGRLGVAELAAASIASM